MKKFLFASALALAAASVVLSPALRAQEGSVSLPPEQYNAYQLAITQSDPKAKAAALESFLTAYPQSQIKNSVMEQLIEAYQAAGDRVSSRSAAERYLKSYPDGPHATLARDALHR